jgi:asparagine synthase (glutamine-hydrolysing)
MDKRQPCDATQEPYLVTGTLVSEEAWRTFVARTKEETARLPDVAMEIQRCEWLAAFEHAVLTRAKATIAKDMRIGLLFSGGLDSAFIGMVLHKNAIPFTCYTVGFREGNTKESDDVDAAVRMAEQHGWAIHTRILDRDSLKTVVDRTVAILGKQADPVSTAVAAVVVAATDLAKEDGTAAFFGGLGAEEIFAGYERHVRAEEVTAECWRGLSAMYHRDLARDCAMASALRITLLTPFLDPPVIRLAMRFPGESKLALEGIDDRKAVLRAMAVQYGMPPAYALRPKRAAQYGSRFAKGMLRIAKREGHARKGDYIVSKGGSPGKDR